MIVCLIVPVGPGSGTALAGHDPVAFLGFGDADGSQASAPDEDEGAAPLDLAGGPEPSDGVVGS